MSDKTESPTRRRLRRAREEGDSGASGYAAQALAFLAAVALAPAAVRATAARASEHIRAAMAVGPFAAGSFDPVSPAVEVIELASPILAAAGVVAAVAHAVQTSGVVAGRRVVPDLRRLGPAAGLKALFSGVHLFAVLRALLAASAVGVIAYGVARDHVADWARLSGRLHSIAPAVSAAAQALALRAALVGLALGALDLFVARQSWLCRLRMTKDEVRREHRDSEGDPQTKAARERAYQETLAQATVNVGHASVVVINPTHRAWCALRYDPGKGDEIPVVTAKGEGYPAVRMANAARGYGVPVVHDEPLARALVALELGQVIPEAIYEAVAEVLSEISGPSPGGAATG